MAVSGPPPTNGYLGRVLDSLQESVSGVGKKVDDLSGKVEGIKDEQRKLREEMTMRQAKAFDTALAMLPELGLMRWDQKEAEALRLMVARELAGNIMQQKKEADLKWWQTRLGRAILLLTVIALLCTVGTFMLAIYNAFVGVSHPIIPPRGT